jgi:hypothetical protein
VLTDWPPGRAYGCGLPIRASSRVTVAVVPPLQDPRLQARRLEVKFEKLRRDRASKPLEKTPGRLRTILHELLWRWQLRRSLSGRMRALGWMVMLLLCWLAGLGVLILARAFKLF